MVTLWALLCQGTPAAATGWRCEPVTRTGDAEMPDAVTPAVPLLDRHGKSLVGSETGLGRLMQLHTLVTALERSDADTLGRLRGLNNFWNERLDADTRNTASMASGSWSTPGQVLDRGHGSVAELALGKYFSLLAAGVTPSQLRLEWVELVAGTQERSRPHMVVGWCAPGQPLPWLLDAFDRDVRRADQRPELRPVVSFDAQGLWHDRCDEVEDDSPQTPVCDGLLPDEFDWRDLLGRIAAEGWR